MTDLQQLDADRQKFLSTVSVIMCRPEHWLAIALNGEIEATIRALRQLQALAALTRQQPDEEASSPHTAS